MNVIDRVKTNCSPCGANSKMCIQISSTWKGLASLLSTTNHMFAMKYKFVFVFVLECVCVCKEGKNFGHCCCCCLFYSLHATYICICVGLYIELSSIFRCSVSFYLCINVSREHFCAKQNSVMHISMLMNLFFFSLRFIRFLVFIIISSISISNIKNFL